MLISHMQDLQEVTHDLHYENYRAQVLTHRDAGIRSESGGLNESINTNADTIEAKEAEILRMKALMEQMQKELALERGENSPILSKNHRGPPPPPRKY